MSARLWKGVYIKDDYASNLDAVLKALMADHPDWEMDIDEEWDTVDCHMCGGIADPAYLHDQGVLCKECYDEEVKGEQKA